MSVSCDSLCNVEHAQYSATRATICSLRTAADVYRLDCGDYPTEAEGLLVLISSQGSTNWHGPYLEGKTLPLDAWGNAYAYSVSNGAPAITSAGADGQFGTDDDVNKDSRYKSRIFGCTRF